MGTPILADSIVAKTGKAGGKNVPSGDGYEPLSMFGDASVQNLVDEKYSYNDDVEGIYVWYAKAAKANSVEDDTEDASVSGSNVGGTNSVFFTLSAGVAGIIIGLFIGFIIRRKKQPS